MMQHWPYRPSPEARIPDLGRPQGICQFSGCKHRTTGTFTHKGLTFDLCDRHLFAALG